MKLQEMQNQALQLTVRDRYIKSSKRSFLRSKRVMTKRAKINNVRYPNLMRYASQKLSR